MKRIGRYEFVIDAYLTDFKGRATLPMIGGFMLQAATKHAEERGFGYSAMATQQKAWVLSRMVIELTEYPQNDTIFIINTWVADVNKLFTERYFSFQNQSGKTIGYAKSIWASIDLETRRPTNVLELEGLVDYINKEESCLIDGVRKILPIKDSEPIDYFTVKYSDVDINKHLNSMKYIEHFVDFFDMDMFVEKEIKRFQINYVNEALYGAKIDILKKEESEGSVFVLEMKNQDVTICTSHIIWN